VKIDEGASMPHASQVMAVASDSELICWRASPAAVATPAQFHVARNAPTITPLFLIPPQLRVSFAYGSSPPNVARSLSRHARRGQAGCRAAFLPAGRQDATEPDRTF